MFHLTKAEEQHLENIGLEPQVKLLYLYLRERCFYDKTTCFPCQNQLANDMKRSVRTIRRYLTVLCDCGLITKRQRGYRQTNEYTLPTKGIGQTVDRITKNCKNSNKQVIGQARPTETPTNFIIDDYTPVQDIINDFKSQHGTDVVDKALERISGKKISIKGFYTYFKKVIETILQYLENFKKYEAIKQNFKAIREFKKYKNHGTNSMNNFKQRKYDFNILEESITAVENGETVDIEKSLAYTYITPTGDVHNSLNNFKQRDFDFHKVENEFLIIDNISQENEDNNFDFKSQLSLLRI